MYQYFPISVHLKFGLKTVVAFGGRHLIRGGLLQYKFSLKLRKENALASLRSDSALYIPKIPNLLNLLGKNKQNFQQYWNHSSSCFLQLVYYITYLEVSQKPEQHPDNSMLSLLLVPVVHFDFLAVYHRLDLLSGKHQVMFLGLILFLQG